MTITDHDTIDGCLELADRPDCFVSEELTAHFAGEPQAVHILCYGITPGDHEWLQEYAGDVEACAAYLHENEIACALAHPFYNVAAPLTRRHRRRLAELFPIWEVRNGSRAPELNMPAVVYVETHGSTGIGGSDDHAGVDIGRTYTEVPAASTPEEFLARVRSGDAAAGGEQGSAAKWAHAAMALATRALAIDATAAGDTTPDPATVLKIAQRVVGQGAAREGAIAADIGPDDARALLDSWLRSIGVELRGRELIDHLQAEDFSHADLYRRARRIHDRRLRTAIDEGTAAVARGDVQAAVGGALRALLPAIPYAPPTVFLGAEKAKLAGRSDERPRVALIADGIEAMHGVTHTIEQIRERGVPGFEVEVVGTDPWVDRRLPAATSLQRPLLRGDDAWRPGPARSGRDSCRRPLRPGPRHRPRAIRRSSPRCSVASPARHSSPATTPSSPPTPDCAAAMAVSRRSPTQRLAPSTRRPRGSSRRARRLTARCSGLGAEGDRIDRWERGVDTDRFTPEKAERGAFPGELRVLYAGRLTREKGVDLLAESFLLAQRAEPRLHLLLAGGGPEEGELRARLGERATFLGWLEGDELARAYASADLFLFCSRTDTYGQVVLEAGASGLPVVAVGEGGPAALIENRHTGILCRPDADHLAGAVLQLASSPALRGRLGEAAVRNAGARSWERALEQLAGGYRRALAEPAAAGQAPSRAA